jgi:hypothetical protein
MVIELIVDSPIPMVVMPIIGSLMAEIDEEEEPIVTEPPQK